jgi:DNA-binding MarR family transcriptional regulator
MQYVGQGAKITELAEKAQMTKQSMSSLVNDMEKAGYLKRYVDKKDSRAWVFKLTARGNKAVAAATAIINDILDKWTKLLGQKKMLQLIYLLEELDGKIKE